MTDDVPEWVANKDMFEGLDLDDAQYCLDRYAPEGIALIGFVQARDEFRAAVERAALAVVQAEARCGFCGCPRRYHDATNTEHIEPACYGAQDGWPCQTTTYHEFVVQAERTAEVEAPRLARLLTYYRDVMVNSGVFLEDSVRLYEDDVRELLEWERANPAPFERTADTGGAR